MARTDAVVEGWSGGGPGEWWSLALGLVLTAALAAGAIRFDDAWLPLGAFILVPLAAAALTTVRVTLLLAGAASTGPLVVGLAVDSESGSYYVARVGLVMVGSLLSVLVAVVRTRRESLIVRRERELAESRTAAEAGRRLGLALQAGRMGSWAWSEQEQRVLWDAQLEAIFGLPPRGYDGSYETWVAMLHPDDRAGVLGEVERAMAEASTYVVRHRIVQHGGAVRWLEGRGEVTRDATGAVTGTTGVVIDVTEQRLEATRNQARSELLDRLVRDDRLFDVTTSDDVAAAGCALAHDLLGATATAPAVEGVVASDSTDARSLHAGAVRWRGARHALLPVRVAQRLDRVLDLRWPEVDPPPDRWLVEEIGQRLAGQIALATVVAGQRAVEAEVAQLSQRLQAGLVPTTVGRHAALATSSWYLPGHEGLLVGGDFLDTVALPDGRLAFAIGDVAGHGPEAAALGATLRGAWCGAVMGGGGPVDWLHRLERLLPSRRDTAETFVTVLTGVVAPDGQSATLASAGHPAPIVLDRQGATDVRVAGPGLGLVDDEVEDRSERTIRLAPPWTLVAYTDGLVEGRFGADSVERLGADRLRQRLATDLVPGTLPDLVRLARWAAAAHGDSLPDDVAVLALGAQPHDAEGGGFG